MSWVRSGIAVEGKGMPGARGAGQGQRRASADGSKSLSRYALNLNDF